MRVWIGTVAVLAWATLSPAAADAQEAQGSIAGIARDASGGVLPGVTVEAASPALIEKVRTAVTDGTGQYRIINLVSGTYTVTFTLNGFSTFKREGIVLEAGFVAAINADMTVGTLAETITVTGETPLVDVQSAKRVRTLDNELVQALPTAKGYASIMLLIPSMTTGTGAPQQVQLQPGMIVFGGRGGRTNEGRVQVDGLNTGASLNGGGVSGYRQDIENSSEIAMTTSGGLGEAEVGGPAMNIIPKTGGNTFQGHFFATGLNSTMQSDNFTQRVIDAGLTRPNRINYNYDTSVSSGGPVIKDRLWYYGLVYYRGAGNDISMFHNKNAGDITKWTYVADPNRPAKSDSNGPLQPNLRLTFQLSQRNKLNLFWDEQISSNSIGQGDSDSAPETGGWNHGFQRVQQAKWTSTATNKLLLEAGVGTYLSNWNTRERPDNDRRLIQITEQCPASTGCANNGNISGLTYHGMNTWNADWIGAHTWNAAASYVTGTHNMKFGYQGAYHVDNRAPGGNNMAFRVANGVPNQLTQRIADYRTLSRVPYYAFYAQDQWTRDRLTVQGAVRFDHPWSTYPEQSIGGVAFLPAVTTFPETRGVQGYNDLTPRMGLAYDLRGTGKTAVKFNMGRYLEAAVNGNGNYSALLPASRVPVTASRTWTDRDGDFVPDCDLLNPSAQSATVDFCGQISQLAFGRSNPTLFYDPLIMQGWGVRPADWQIGATFQHEVLPRVSMELGYVRRWLQNFTVTDNRAQAATDFGAFSVTAPLDPRLPGGGGYVVSGFVNANQNVFALTDNYRTYAPNYGNQYSIYNGLEMSVNARLRSGIQLQAGSSTGSQVTDDCEVRAKLPETGVPAIGAQNAYCHNAPGIRTRATAAGSYTIPKIDVLLAGTFQSSPGVALAANYTVTSAVVAQSLGRPLSNNATNVTVNLLKPGDVFGERVNQLDFRVGKVLRFGRQRATISADLLNAMNSDAILGYNQGYNPTGNWLVPTSVLTARSTKITVQWDF
jgi:Carboxypeptidase regulatory-like domain